MNKESHLPAIEHVVWIDAPRQRVFQQISTAWGWDQWFMFGAKMQAEAGGRFEMRWSVDGPYPIEAAQEAEIIEIRSPELFSFRWNQALGETTVRFVLDLDAGGTRVHLEDAGYPDTEAGRKRLVGCASGWGEALTLLKFHCEYGLTYRHGDATATGEDDKGE